MVRLEPMTEAEFAAFEEHDILEYAEAEVRSGFWSEADALQKAREAHRRLLPDGLATKDQYLYTIRETRHNAAVGLLWMMVQTESAQPSGFIYDIEIDPAHRRKGYAREAMRELEALTRKMGLHQLGLHVFAYNTGARALYESLGYRVASVNMLKDL